MKYGRSEIERLLFLWAEGRLDDVQTEQLISFLENHPEMISDDSFLSLPGLRPSQVPYHGKEKLRKSLSDLSRGQIEYLSVAALENDLSEQGKKELEEIVEADESGKRIYSSILRTKLIPPSYCYPHKNRLRKLTVQQKVLRYSIAVISSAAAIALFVTVMMPALLERSTQTASEIQNISVADTLILYSGEPLVRSAAIKGRGIRNEFKAVRIAQITVPSRLPAAEIRESDPVGTGGYRLNKDLNLESFIPEIRNLRISILAEKHYPLAGFPERLRPYVFEKNRSNVDRFVAKLIHNRILKDTLSVDRPVKGYDLAEAGIASVNRLLGWEMALVRTTNKEGDLKSVYFSSAVLKFNVPVKKSNPDE